MNSTGLRVSCVLILLTSMNVFAEALPDTSFLVNAYDQSTGEPLYRAFHQIYHGEQGQYQHYRVDYVTYQGQPIARKELSFDGLDHPLAIFRPDLAFYDHRNRQETVASSALSERIYGRWREVWLWICALEYAAWFIAYASAAPSTEYSTIRK